MAKPERPMGMARTDAAGAEAAARYFLSLYPYIMQSGDVAEWDAMTFETCDFCKENSGIASEISKNGDTYVGGKITVTNLHVLPIDEDLRGYPIDVDILKETSVRSNLEGVVVANGERERLSIRVDAFFHSDHWAIASVAKPS